MGPYIDFIVEKQGALAIVTLNRPDKGNSWTLATYQEMEKIQEELHYDEDVRVVIFTGAGDKFFCAGADLALLAMLDSHFISRDIYRYQGINTRWDRFIKPVIMAINGITVEVAWSSPYVVIFALPQVLRAFLSMK